MKTAYRYTLETYNGKNRYHCPSCQHKKKFSRYIDTETGEHISPNVGRCNRESKCGHHYTPKQYFQDNNISFDTINPVAYKQRTIAPPKPVSFIPFHLFRASLKAHEANHFVQRLVSLFGAEVASGLVNRYFIGTSKHWNGATVFWQIDTNGKVRTGKIMLYNPTTGKRVKNLELPVYWVHKALKQPEFELKQCLFGEHLLIDKTKPVAIVESEKTAVIASVYLPQFIWLASSGLNGLNAEKCSVLKGRTVTLFPDVGCFDKWSSKAEEFSHLAIFTVSNLLELKATETERIDGLDIADYLVEFSYKSFARSEPEAPEAPPLPTTPAVQPLVELKPVEQSEPVYYFSKTELPMRECWEQDITELENYFAAITIPTQPLKLDGCCTITNCSSFIESHLATVKANNGNRTYKTYLNRLHAIKNVLK